MHALIRTRAMYVHELGIYYVGQRWPCVLRRAALDSVSRVKEVLGSIPPAIATEIK